MGAPDPAALTEQQKKWFASVREGLVRTTGKTVDEWAELARACPETAHRKRLAWMKEAFGLGQNHASLILGEAFPSESSWAEPEALADKLWSDPGQRKILMAVKAAVAGLPEVVTGQRKDFTAFSRKYQFASVRPAKGGARLGLAVEPSDGLEPASKNEGWSERLKSSLTLSGPEAVDARVKALLEQAWERS